MPCKETEGYKITTQGATKSDKNKINIPRRLGPII